ncbi:hypothetical protein GGR51DRAFT_415346 [Nemania sp. FL0031]|nr:hypothetical protein GGR51DRAFT_415346 [Nemania sp. FL0031]
MQEHAGVCHAGQHLVASKNPFKCHCGKEFAKLFTLERHIQGSEKSLNPEYPCTECTIYQGKSAFARKDHLVQHLRCIHGYDDDKLATIYPPRKTRKYFISVCHFEDCDYYRPPDFADLPVGERKNNRPFDKQSDYTTHMKHEHDWSPYPCKVSGCDKLGRKGFFSITSLGKHCKEKHPGTAIAAPVARSRRAESMMCDGCRNILPVSKLTFHQMYKCKEKVECGYCHERMEFCRLSRHEDNNCTKKVSCGYCQESMESRLLESHHKNDCKGQVACRKCSRLFERREAETPSLSSLWSLLLGCPSCHQWFYG